MIKFLASKTTIKLLLTTEKFVNSKKSQKTSKSIKNIKMKISLIIVAPKVLLRPNKCKRQKTAKTLAQKYTFRRLTILSNSMKAANVFKNMIESVQSQKLEEYLKECTLQTSSYIELQKKQNKMKITNPLKFLENTFRMLRILMNNPKVQLNLC